MVFQFLVIAFFVLLSLRHVVQLGGAGALADTTPFANHATTLAGISAGAAIAAYSFLGFDAVTTLTEETIEPKRTMPRAILLIALIGGGIFIAVAYATQLVHPGSAFTDAGSAAFEIARAIGGDVFSSVFLAGLVVAQFASGIAAQASTSRLLFAMGRDSVLPRRLFGCVHPRFRTPAFNILLTGAVGLIALRMNVATSTSFINFGAFTAFTFVNLSVLATYLRSRRAGDRPRVLPYVIAPVIGAAGGHLAAGPSRLQGADPGPDLARRGRRLPHLPHEGLPQAAAEDGPLRGLPYRRRSRLRRPGSPLRITSDHLRGTAAGSCVIISG